MNNLILARTAEHIRKYEGSKRYMYCDTSDKPGGPFVTTANGHCMVHPSDAFATGMYWVYSGGQIATREMIVAAFEKVKRHGDKNKGKNLRAEAYEHLTTIRLHPDCIRELLMSDLEERAEKLDVLFSEREHLDFQEFPPSAKVGLLDMAYNMGPYKFWRPANKGGYPKMLGHIRAGRWDLAATECSRKPPISKERNEATAALFMQAHEEVSATTGNPMTPERMRMHLVRMMTQTAGAVRRHNNGTARMIDMGITELRRGISPDLAHPCAMLKTEAAVRMTAAGIPQDAQARFLSGDTLKPVEYAGTGNDTTPGISLASAAADLELYQELIRQYCGATE